MTGKAAVGLRALTADDDALLATLMRRPEVQRHIGRLGRDEPGLLVIDTPAVAVGIVGLVRGGTDEHPARELICAILEGSEGRGIAEAACRRYFAQEQPAGRILATVSPDNPRSRRLAERLGYVRTSEPPNLYGDDRWEMPAISLARLIVTAPSL